MKKRIALGILCLFLSQLGAQNIKIDFNKEEADERVSPMVREKVDEYALQVRAIVVEQKVAMKEEIDQVETDLKVGKISASEAENQKAAISLRFSEQINSEIEKLNFNVDEITKQQVKYTILNTDVEQLKVEVEIKTNKKAFKPINQMVMFLDYGIIHLPKDNHQPLNDHLGFSSGIDFGLVYWRQLSKTSPLQFMSGIYLSWKTLRFDDDYYIRRAEDGVVDLVQHDGHLKKSKLRGTYLVVPLGLQYSFSKLKYDEDGNTYRPLGRGLSLTANVFGGVRISNNNIVKGDGINFRHRKTDLNLNHLNYGAQFTLGINSWDFFVRQELNPTFKDGTMDNRRMTQFGIVFGF